MKNNYLFLWLIILICIVSNNIFAQKYYYYYEKEKQPLEMNPQYLYVLFKGEPKESDWQGYKSEKTTINKLTKSRLSDIQQKYLGYQEDLYVSEIFLPESKSEQDCQDILAKLKKSDKVWTVMPYFKNSKFQKLSLSNWFYVKLKQEKDFELLKEQAKKMGAFIVEQNELMPLWFTLSCLPQSQYNSLEIANAFQESGLFEHAEPDWIVRDERKKGDILPIDEMGNTKKTTPCVNDPLFNNQWGLQNNTYPGIDIKACQAWEYSKGSGVKVGIIHDGFVSNNHPDFIGNISPLNYNAVTGGAAVQYSNMSDGIPIAGIIGGVQNNGYGISGVAPKCQLVYISVKADQGIANYIVNAINWATGNVDVINIDNTYPFWQIPDLTVITDAINNATTNGRGGKGCVITCPIGFSWYTENYVHYPAALPNVLSTGYIQRDGLRSFSSCYGTHSLDVVAPMGEIVSYDNMDELHSAAYANWFCFASAHVAGVAALMLEVAPSMKWQQVYDTIKSTSQKIRRDIYDYNITKPQGTWNDQMGFGLINAYAAVQQAIKTELCLSRLIEEDQTTTSHTTWNFIKRLYKPFTVKAGHTLAINSTIVCETNAKIMVEAGGKLVIDGGILTTCDNKTWQGIELRPSYGSASAGWLDMKNGARIENATIGVKISSEPFTLYDPWGLIISYTYEVGRITGINSTFRNCKTAFDYYGYIQKPGGRDISLSSYFYKCNFEGTDACPFPRGANNLLFVNLVYAWDVTFAGCTFRDIPTDYSGYNYQGIKSSYSKFKVTEYCVWLPYPPQPTCNGVRSVFENLSKYITVYDANNPANIVCVDNSDFNIAHGPSYFNIVYLSGCTNAKITSNKFRSTVIAPSSVPDPYAYITLLSCDNYKVEANDFDYMYPNQVYIKTNDGIYVNNGHTKNEVIYRNTFANYGMGITASGKNKYYNPRENPQYRFDGLQILCNNFKGAGTKHVNVYSSPQSGEGIALSQGTSSEPAGNKFTNATTSLWDSYFGFLYYYNNVSPYIPTNNSSCISLYTTNAINTCPQKIISNDGGGIVFMPSFTPMKEFETTTEQWYAQTDGGNTEALLAQTEIAISKTNGTKAVDAIQKSKGFLSDQVLLAVAKNESGFTPEMVRDIMVANPQCTRNQEVMKALKNRIKPLDDKMMAEILAGEKVISAREKLEMEIADNGRKITNAIDDNLRLLSSDSVDRSKEIVEQLNYFPIPEYKYQLAQFYFDKNDMKAYQSTLSELDKLITYDVDKEYFQRWCKLNDNVTNWTTVEKFRLDSLPQEPIQYLIDLVWTEEGRLQAKAASILALNGIYIYPERKREEIINDDKKIIPDLQANTSETDIEFMLHPNPAKESLTFSYQIDQDVSKALVYIYHSSGTLAETINIEPGGNSKTINTGNLTNGIYYCRFIVDGKTINTIKLVIAK